MGQAAVEVLTKPETARRLSENGLKFAQLFDWKTTAAHTYERVYQPLLEAAGTKAAVDI